MSTLESAPPEAPEAPADLRTVPGRTSALPTAATVLSLARRAVVALALLLPIAVELVLRDSKRERWLEVGVLYLAAVVAFAWVAPPLAPLAVARAAARRVRWPLVVGALSMAALGTWICFGGPSQPILFPIWLAGVLAWLVAWARRPRVALRGGWWVWTLAGFVALAAGLRFYRLEQWPLQMDEMFITGDVMYYQRQGISLLWPTFLFDHKAPWPNTQMAVSLYLRMLSYSLLDVNFFSLRIVSVLEGIAEVALLFPLAWFLFGGRVALIATATLATLGVHVSFSRYGQENLEASLIWTGVAGLLALGFARRSVPSLALAGLALSLCLQTYPSAHAAPAFVAAALLIAGLDPELRGRWLGGGALALLGGLAVGMGPLMATYYRDPRVFVFQSELAAWLPNAIRTFGSTADPAALWPLWDHFARALLGHNMIPAIEYNYQPGRPMFLSAPTALLFSGLALVCLRLRDWRFRLIALWFWAPFGLSWLSDNPPAPHRALPALPASAILIGLALDRVVAGWQALGPTLRRWAPAIGGAALVPFLVVEAAFNFGEHGRFDPDPWNNALIRQIVALPPGKPLVFMETDVTMRGGLDYASQYEVRNPWDLVRHARAELPETRDRPLGVTYFLNTNRTGWLDLLREVYPGGRAFELRTLDPRAQRLTYRPPGGLLWTVYDVDGDAIDRARGLQLVATDASGRRTERREPVVGLSEPLPPGTTYPVDLEWRGWLHRQHWTDPDRFVSLGTVAPRLWLGDATMELPEVPGETIVVPLPPGPMPLRATARLARPTDTVRVQWDGVLRLSRAYKIELRTDIPPPRAQRDFPIHQASHWPGEPRTRVDWLDGEGRLLRRDYDALIADYALDHRRPRDADERSIARFSGQIDVPRRASYEFYLMHYGGTRLLIDGRVVSVGGDASSSRAAVWLEPGRRSITVDVESRFGGTAVLLWRPPGGATPTVMPPSVFVPIPWP